MNHPATIRRGMITERERFAEREHTMFSRPIIAVAGGCAALALLASGCGNGSDHASVAGPGGSPGAPSTTATGHDDAAPSGMPSTGGGKAGDPAPCGAATLRARLDTNPGAAAGSRFAALVLTNTGSAPCRTYGYVGLKLAGDGDPPTHVVRGRDGGPAPRRVMLKPGASAWTRLQWGVVPGQGDRQTGRCRPTATRLWVTPPDQRTHLTVPWRGGPVCQAGTIHVTPLRPGDHDPRATH